MAESDTLETQLKILQTLLQPNEKLTPDSPEYISYSQTWASHKQLRPHLVVRPTSVETLSKVIVYLYTTPLDFAIYGHGFGSTSAKDVLVNTSAFNDFHFDRHSETVTIGAGQAWVDVYRKMEVEAPGYGIVGARTPSVGVAGTIVTGGISWLSNDHGCISDPANMLDAKVVKYNGTIVWASSEPELLWALRGGGGGFCVIVSAILRVFPYPQDIWAGPVLVPRGQLETVADGLAGFLSRDPDPKVTMFLYVMKKKLLASLGDIDSDMLIIHAYDANGEAHGRETFRWALSIPGAIDQTKVTTFTGVIELQDKVQTAKGTMKQTFVPLVLQDLPKETIINAINWFEDLEGIDESIADCTYLIFEVLCGRDPAGSNTTVAWPRPPGAKHILLLGPGCPADAGPEKERLVKKLAMEGPSKVLGKDAPVSYLPNGYGKHLDPKLFWGSNVVKLQALRKKYDPKDRFKGSIKLAP